MKLITAFALSTALLGAPSLHAETIDATIVAGHPGVFRWVRMFPEAFEPAVNAALEGSGYDMKFTEQFGGTIAGVGEELETVSDGLAEIGTIQSLFDPAKMPLQNVTYYTPFVSDDPRLIGELMNDLTINEPMLRQTYDDLGIVPLGGPMAIDSYLLLTTFPVESLADMQGRKIATAGAAVNWLNGTGAVGVSGQIPMYYNDLKTGVYEGVILFATAALPAKLHEVAPYITELGLGAQFAGSIGANKDWFDSQPEEVRQALTAGAEAAGEWYITSLEKGTTAALEQMAAEGATITKPSGEMRKAWAEGLGALAGDWAAQLDEQGLPGSEVLSLYMQRVQELGAVPLRDWATK